jgi:hypothetical protein
MELDLNVSVEALLVIVVMLLVFTLFNVWVLSSRVHLVLGGVDTIVCLTSAPMEQISGIA